MFSISSRSSQRLSVVLFASVLAWAACGSETHSVAPTDIGPFVERGRAMVEDQVQVWRSQGIPEWAIAQRLEAAESFFAEVTAEGWTPTRAASAAKRLAVFRAATDRAVADGKVTPKRGETLVDQYQDYLRH